MTAADLGYIAGYIDGEGCILFQDTPVVGIVNTYPRELRRIANIFGGSVRKKNLRPPWRQTFEWRICGQKALAFLREILPHLNEKLPQAELVMKMAAMPKHKRDPLKVRLAAMKRINHV